MDLHPKWDGTYLGVIDEEMIISETKAHPLNLMELELGGTIYRVSYHRAGNNYACMVDEIAPLFNIGKMGTHLIKRDGKQYIIYRRRENATTLKEYDKRKLNLILRREIQDVFVFRRIMGLGTNSESSVLITLFGAVSYRNRLEFQKPCESNEISKSVMEQWFVDDFAHSFKRMRALEDADIFVLRRGICEVIKRLSGEDTFGLEAQIISSLDKIR